MGIVSRWSSFVAVSNAESSPRLMGGDLLVHATLLTQVFVFRMQWVVERELKQLRSLEGMSLLSK
jgi:hypothetical protein